MKKNKMYKVTCYPNVEKFITRVEAKDVDEAIRIAEAEAYEICWFTAVSQDVEEVR